MEEKKEGRKERRKERRLVGRERKIGSSGGERWEGGGWLTS